MDKMEQRLAEFRARKKAEAATRHSEQTPNVSSEKQVVTCKEKTEDKPLPQTRNREVEPDVPATTTEQSRVSAKTSVCHWHISGESLN